MNNNNEDHSYFVMPARRVSKSKGKRTVLVIHDKEYDAKDIHWEVQRSPRHPIYIVKAEPEEAKTEKNNNGKTTMPRKKNSDAGQACVTSGLIVIARNEKDGLYYTGHVHVTLSRKCAVVVFDNNEQQKTKTKLIIPMGGSVPRPELNIGDFVLVRVLSVNAENECYVPGRVRHLPQRLGDQMKFYTIIMYNGQECTTMRSHLVKIGQVRFYETVKYIAELQSSFGDGQNTEKEEKSQRSRSSLAKSKSGSKSQSRSRSRSESKSRSKSRSESRSRSRSESRGRSRSESSSRSRSESRSRSRSESSSRSRSESRSRSRSESKSRSRSRSNSRSRSRSRSRSGRRSGSYSRPRSQSRSLSRSRSSSRNRMEDRKQGQLYPRDEPASDRNGATARLSHRKNISPYPPQVTQSLDENQIREIIKDTVTRLDIFVTDPKDDKEKKLSDLEQQLREQQIQQEKQKIKLLKQARKINKMRHKMKMEEKIIIVQPGTNSEDIPRPVIPDLEEGEDVLACWPDDGWFYWGTVSEKKENQIYVIMDQTRHQEEICRDHILTESENTNINLQHHDCVIAAHPQHKNSYAPGKVLSVRNRQVEIKFYDDEVDAIDMRDIFSISSPQYDSYVRYIRKCEQDIIGRKVLTRNNDNGRYILGKVLGFTSSSLQYQMQGSDGATISQRIVHIFNKENMTKITHLQEKDCVLAKPYGKSYYIPAVIQKLSPLNVKFCDGSRTTGSDDCLWLNEDYYENAKNYYLDREHSQPDNEF